LPTAARATKRGGAKEEDAISDCRFEKAFAFTGRFGVATYFFPLLLSEASAFLAAPKF
jgi:hypothetical protein